MDSWLQTLIGSQNQFLQGGLVLMVVGAIGASLRRLPSRLYQWVKSRCVLSLSIMNDDRAFQWLSVWLDNQPYMKKTRRLSLSTVWVGGDNGKYKIVFTPAPGIHIFWYKGRLVWLQRERAEKETVGMSYEMKRQETYNLTILGRDQQIARDILREAQELNDEKFQKAASIHASMFGEWARMGPVSSRSLSSVFLPAGQKESLLADVERFLASKAWYQERGIPWRRGYLLYGLPGAGKSSLIGALAGHLNMNLYTLNLSSPALSDEKLTELIFSIEEKSLLLIEDLDAVTVNREEKGEMEKAKGKTTGLSLSGLLNALDGVAAREGLLTFMTSNYAERLDGALIRSGRVDFRLEFTKPTKDQILAYLQHFYGRWEGTLPAVESMAQLQELCLKSPRNPEALELKLVA